MGFFVVFRGSSKQGAVEQHTHTGRLPSLFVVDVVTPLVLYIAIFVFLEV